MISFSLVGLALAIFLAPFDASATDISLPNGWRAPDEVELSDAWRGDSPERHASVAGDFNGDGQGDRAMLLVSDARHSFALFVYLSAGKSHIWHKVIETKDQSLIHGVGVEVVPPGEYKTACGKGYVKCKRGEPRIIRPKADVINYYKTESWSSYVYFDASAKSLKRVWMSD